MLFRRSPPPAPPLRSGECVQVSAGAAVRLRVHPRAKRISLRVDAPRREVVLTVPGTARVADGLAFARTRARWIAERLAELPQPCRLAPGQVIEVEGEPCRLDRLERRGPARFLPAGDGEPARLAVGGADGDSYARAAERGLCARALERLQARTDVHCATLGQPVPPLRLQDARSRWGSCRPATPGRPASIRYNWRLVLAPPAVLDYVAAHECAHLLEANHGPRFWAIVRRLYGDPTPARAWLKRQGAALQALGGE